MLIFQYRSVSASGQIHAGEHRARDVQALATWLAGRGETLLDAKRDRRSRTVLRSSERVFWLQELVVLLSAGLPLHDALTHLARASGASARCSRVLADAVAGGEPFSQALQNLQGQFSATAVAFVRAGEASGDLAAALHNLAETDAWWCALRQRLVKALTYPVLTLAVLAVIVPVLFVVLVPQLMSLLDVLGVTMPWYTLALLSVSRFVADWGGMLIGIIVLCAVIIVLLCGPGRPFETWWSHRLLCLPVLGRLLCNTQLALSCRQIAALYKAGVSLDESFLLARQGASNPVFKLAFAKTAERIRSGQSVSESVSCSPVFPSVMRQLVQTGEHSGRLDITLLQASDVFARAADRQADRLISSAGPLLLAVVAGVMGWLVAALLLPLYSSLLSFGAAL